MILPHVDESHWSALANTMALSPVSLMLLDGYLQVSYFHRGRWHLLRFPQETLKTSGTSLVLWTLFAESGLPNRISSATVWCGKLSSVWCDRTSHQYLFPTLQMQGPSSPHLHHNTTQLATQSRTEAFARSAERPAVTPRPAQAARAHRRDTFTGSRQCFFSN